MRPKKPRTNKPIPVTISPEFLARLQTIAEAIGETRSTVMRMAMKIGVEKLEADPEENPASVVMRGGKSAKYPGTPSGSIHLNDGGPNSGPASPGTNKGKKN